MAESLIQNYKASALNRSDLVKPALSNQYQVFISGIPDKIKNYLKESYNVDTSWVSRNVGLLCADATLPTSSFATSEVKDNFQGINQQFAHTRLYVDSDFTFYVDYNYNMIKFFEGWMDFISGGDEGVELEHKGFYRRFNYPNEYKCQGMTITKFERDYQRSGTYLQYNFVNAFPKGMTAIPVSYGASDLVKVTVTFAYDRYVVNETLKASNDPAPPLNEETQVKSSPKPNNKADGKSKTQNKYGDIGRGLDAPVTPRERAQVRAASLQARDTDGILRV